MTSPKFRWPNRGNVLIVVGLLLAIAAIPLAVRQVRWGDLVRAMADARLFPWVPLGVAAYLAAMLLRGWRLRLLVSQDTTLSVLAASNVVAVGYAINNVLPGRLGELVRAHALTQRSGLSFAQAAAVTVLERVLDGLVMLFLFSIAASAMPRDIVESRLVLGLVNGLAISLFAAFAAIIAVAALSPHNFTRALAGAAGSLNAKWYQPVYVAGLQITSAVAYLRNPTGTVIIAALSLGTWLVESLMFLLILPSFGLPLGVLQSLLTMTVTNLGIALPSTPGFIGTWHAFCSETLRLFGVDASIALSYAIVTHLTFYVPITLWGVAVLAASGVGWGRAIRLARSSRGAIGGQESGVFAVLPPPGEHKQLRRHLKFYNALLDAILPAGELNLDTATANAARRYVFDFIEGQFQSLPNRLFILFSLGIFGFRLLTYVRYFRSFESLRPSTRDHWFSLWADGPIALTRKLFRPVRSLALLGFYEYGPVERALEATGAP